VFAGKAGQPVEDRRTLRKTWRTTLVSCLTFVAVLIGTLANLAAQSRVPWILWIERVEGGLEESRSEKRPVQPFEDQRFCERVKRQEFEAAIRQMRQSALKITDIMDYDTGYIRGARPVGFVYTDGREVFSVMFSCWPTGTQP
jgi:hypothetical protein